jgi:hypothetical protein
MEMEMPLTQREETRTSSDALKTAKEPFSLHQLRVNLALEKESGNLEP